MASELALVSPLPASDQLVLTRADIFFTRGTGLLNRLIRFFTRGIGESRSPRLIPHAVFLLTLLPSQANMLPAQSEKDVVEPSEREQTEGLSGQDHEQYVHVGSVKVARRKCQVELHWIEFLRTTSDTGIPRPEAKTVT